VFNVLKGGVEGHLKGKKMDREGGVQGASCSRNNQSLHVVDLEAGGNRRLFAH
jgi:hypothetical protein